MISRLKEKIHDNRVKAEAAQSAQAAIKIPAKVQMTNESNNYSVHHNLAAARESSKERLGNAAGS